MTDRGSRGEIGSADEERKDSRSGDEMQQARPQKDLFAFICAHRFTISLELCLGYLQVWSRSTVKKWADRLFYFYFSFCSSLKHCIHGSRYTSAGIPHPLKAIPPVDICNILYMFV